ncbi:response regulator transcription factor [Flavobacterium franklandianum]|uniref:Response regulator transcription factor n=1 Tax=Flavobacterium franklandianum TaxID=2594430 RepID=A0A553CM66_9FLAO|nr:response regulator transcription factor [Flavobacterium franklandianum]TRX21616.1 response regulator transcription factor [Flavobacterium franklandianum]TRX25221.1 response regulator transcription factor [Flavobacterium franklandianum]
MKHKIFIVDDHPMVIEGFKALLSQNENITIVGSAENAFQAIDFLKKNEVDIAFLDINLPDISGVDLCKKIKTEFPRIKCLALSTFNDRNFVCKMIEHGASGYLLKNSSKDEIMHAIDAVIKGNMFFNVDYQKQNTSKYDQKPFLTRRELEILKEIAEGLTNQQIADKLFISITTVSTHRQNLMLKLETGNTALLIKTALKYELI